MPNITSLSFRTSSFNVEHAWRFIGFPRGDFPRGLFLDFPLPLCEALPFLLLPILPLPLPFGRSPSTCSHERVSPREQLPLALY